METDTSLHRKNTHTYMYALYAAHYLLVPSRSTYIIHEQYHGIGIIIYDNIINNTTPRARRALFVCRYLRNNSCLREKYNQR